MKKPVKKITDGARYRALREEGICVADAPPVWLNGKDVDKHVDAMIREARKNKSKKK